MAVRPWNVPNAATALRWLKVHRLSAIVIVAHVHAHVWALVITAVGAVVKDCVFTLPLPLPLLLLQRLLLHDGDGVSARIWQHILCLIQVGIGVCGDANSLAQMPT